MRGKPLPEWAAEFDASTWGQFFLKFVVSNPAVTVATPATSQARHMIDNTGAALGRLSENGASWEQDMRHVLVADITGGHIYRVDTLIEAVTRIHDHPFGVNEVVRDPSGAIWFTQSTENPAGPDSEARMFAAADKPLSGAVWRIAAGELGKAEPVAVKVVEGLDFANGIAFDTARGRLYVAEILASRILSFRVDPGTGALSDRRVLAKIPTPDNLELDSAGDLLAVSPFANAVFAIDPDTGAARKVFDPTPVESAGIVAETQWRLAAGENPAYPCWPHRCRGDAGSVDRRDIPARRRADLHLQPRQRAGGQFQ